MGFKLVRVDAQDPNRIPLTAGTYVIGRGPLLGCEDERVSKEQGLINVTKDTVVLESTHESPCYYNTMRTRRNIILPQGNRVSLTDTDQFGLLPDTYWYELVFCDDDPKIKKHAEVDDLVLCSLNTEYDSSKTLAEQHNKRSSGIHDDWGSGVFVKSECVGQSGPMTEFDGNMHYDGRAHANGPRNGRNNAPTPNIFANNEIGAQTLGKRAHGPEPKFNAKKIKTEHGGSNLDPQNSGGGNVDAAGNENRQNAANGAGFNEDQCGPPDDGAGQLPRERCMYGENCYRRNAEHKMQFCHPQDADYGAGCRRADPRHSRLHDHAERAPAGLRIAQRHGQVYYINSNSVHFHDHVLPREEQLYVESDSY